MKLIPVDDELSHLRSLYDLLAERTPEQSISHKAMPTFEQHRAFVASNPYLEWLLIEEKERVVGSIYLSKQDEIGVFIFNKYQGEGRGAQAVSMMMARHPKKRLLANINQKNEASINCFTNLGFKLIQQTYAYEEQS